MKRVYKSFVLITSAFIAVLLLVAIFSYLNHKIQLSKENDQIIPTGKLYEVMTPIHVYTEGTGKETLLFLSGSGTSSPALDFKSLYAELSDTFQIAVVSWLWF